MRPLDLAGAKGALSVLCLGAHSDDIEIGAGGTLLSLIEGGLSLDVFWCVLSAAGPRETEARASAAAFLKGARATTLETGAFEDSYFPSQRAEIKRYLSTVRERFEPDLILTHRRDDAHQDHRLVNELTSNVFRDHLTLEYEIPKWDGDLGRPNAYVALSAAILGRKTTLLGEHFATQRSKDWFDPEVFEGLARLRGMECRAPERFAEAFTIRKMTLFGHR